MFILLLLPLKHQFYVKEVFMKQAGTEVGVFFYIFKIVYPLYLSKMPSFLGNERRFADIFPTSKQPGELPCKINKLNCLEILENKTQDFG